MIMLSVFNDSLSLVHHPVRPATFPMFLGKCLGKCLTHSRATTYAIGRRLAALDVQEENGQLPMNLSKSSGLTMKPST